MSRADILQAYADGVNAYLEDRDRVRRSASNTRFSRSRTANTRSSQWSPINTLTWAKVMSWDLSGNMKAGDRQSHRSVSTSDAEQVEQLFPPFPEDKPYVLGCRGIGSMQARQTRGGGRELCLRCCEAPGRNADRAVGVDRWRIRRDRLQQLGDRWRA